MRAVTRWSQGATHLDCELTEPGKLPIPPMMTMTNASIIIVAAMPTDAVTRGAASTPPIPARPQPMPNTAERMRFTSFEVRDGLGDPLP